MGGKRIRLSKRRLRRRPILEKRDIESIKTTPTPRGILQSDLSLGTIYDRRLFSVARAVLARARIFSLLTLYKRHDFPL